MRRTAGLVFGLVLLCTPPGLVSAAGGLPCPMGTTPELDGQFQDLQHALGAVMGAATGCPITDAIGDTIQATTTGLAVYRPSGMALFASGDQRWALTADGLQSWRGNWHTGLDPPAAPDGNLPPAPTAVALA